MTVTNAVSGTNVHEVADGIYRINTPVYFEGGPGGFSFNQYLIADDAPLLFHTGPRKMFPLVREAVASVLPPERLRHIAFSHVEADECGSLNDWLDAAPEALPLCSSIAKLVSIDDLADRQRAASKTARRSISAATGCAGSRRRICRTHGNAGCCSTRRRRRCSAATCSRKAAPNCP